MTTYGRNGIFLTSLAALSILTITSHHPSHTQQATLVLHRSRPAARLVPAPSHHTLSHREHGTRVTVHDLFGNMPVRVKQRAIGSSNGDNEKEMQLLNRQVVGLILAWHRPISVSLKNVDSSGKLQIRANQKLPTRKPEKEQFSPLFDLSFICSVLFQAGYIDPPDWEDWIKTSARTPSVMIKGAISRRPAPSKHVQFISLGMHPVNSESSNNVLYDEINRLFSTSSFGTQEEGSDIEEAVNSQRSKDQRSKTDGFTNKQLKGGGKGVDRWPMFYIRLELMGDAKSSVRDDLDRLREGTLSIVLNVLSAMVTSFLDENHLRPRTRQPRLQRHESKSEANFGTGSRLQRRGERLQILGSNNDSYQEHDFSTWSRIKVGTRVSRSATCLSRSQQTQADDIDIDEREAVESVILKSQKSAGTRHISHPPKHDCEQTLDWKNPVSGATVFINARTGLVVEPHPPERPKTAPSNAKASVPSPPTTANTVAIPNHSRRLTRSVSSSFLSPKPGSWSSDLLRKWENPVFNTPEEGIPQISFNEPNAEGSDILHGRRDHCTELDIQKAFAQCSTSFSARLSKTALKLSRFISQVDRRFVLIYLEEQTYNFLTEGSKLLVLVDQHAADERIRVEGLLANLGSSSTQLAKPIVFELQVREYGLLARYAAYLANWGIWYEIQILPESHKCRISVKALPSAIAERCRIEPKILIELIRSEAWKCSEDGSSVTRKACPQGLLDMLNSRACRSAIMFNDELTKEEAQTLVQRLGDCNFPFQCAHGRPSMIPLVDLGSSSSTGLGEKAFGGGNGWGAQREEKAFGEAWRSWKSGI